MDLQNIIDQIVEIVVGYGPKVLGALVVWFLGNRAIKILVKGLGRFLENDRIDPTLRPFLIGLTRTGLKVLLVVSVFTMVGIEMTSFIAILGAAGLAVGMALSGTLQNFAGGVMILIFRPFKVGDYISALGQSGTVREIQIFNTILTTPDNKTIIMPNGEVSGTTMTNFSAASTRRVEWTFGIAYGGDADRAKEVLRELADGDERILKDPEVFIALSELGDSAVKFVMRAWVNAPDYWNVFFSINERAYKAFPEAGLSIPYPQLDVHLRRDGRE